VRVQLGGCGCAVVLVLAVVLFLGLVIVGQLLTAAAGVGG
jgi:hypothetical protein